VVVPREAATVVLLRDSPDGLETWLMRRVPKMAFAPGASVFPGGAVEPEDGVPLGSPEAGDSVAAELAARAEQMRTTPEHAGALLCAAIRETFEEVGVLLATPHVTVGHAVRAAVEDGERSFAGLLTELGVQLELSAVRPWSRWITPEGGPRRYDTYFFVAVIPPELTAAAVTSEASHADWISISAALAEYSAGERLMLLPTITTLTQINVHADTAEVLAAAGERIISPVRPVFGRDADGNTTVDMGDGAEVVLPNGPDGPPATGPR
jgi:8-oxo-dGTP pyrophosphatase MutT (NUDIX family)